MYYDGTSWRDVSVEKGRVINAITAVAEPDGTETVLAAAGAEQNANKLMSYIYKWDGQAWGAPVVIEDVTLRGITALDRYGAWACGFTSKGEASKRGVVMTWHHDTQVWTRGDIYVNLSGYARFTSIVAIDFWHLYVTGYVERADERGTELTGLVLTSVAALDRPLQADWSVGRGNENVAKFNKIAGLSPSTTVAVGLFKDAVADSPPDGPSSGDWGYPAVAWARDDTVRPQKANVSIAYELEVTGVGMKYV